MGDRVEVVGEPGVEAVPVCGEPVTDTGLGLGGHGSLRGARQKRDGAGGHRRSAFNTTAPNAPAPAQADWISPAR
ncbi:hypothetical protein GCM10023336_63140 [Streptomyces similanensis]|uniref:Uncharacterized protein n=1 Tax=Streptomyces similanensis TaxID=1274988 RepID=A0ABP9LEU6_9ACTN